MKTEDLIAALGRDLEPTPQARVWPRLLGAGAVGLALGLAGLAVTLGVRADLAAAMEPTAAKAAFAAFAAALFAPFLVRLAQPGRPMGPAGWALGLVAGVCVVVVAASLLAAAPESRWAAWTGGGFPWCLVLVPLLATPAAGLIFWVLRDLAPTRLALTGAYVGGAAGGLGAMVYAMYCPVDSVAFVLTWYSLAIALSAALGAIVGARLLKW